MFTKGYRVTHSHWSIDCWLSKQLSLQLAPWPWHLVIIRSHGINGRSQGASWILQAPRLANEIDMVRVLTGRLVRRKKWWRPKTKSTQHSALQNSLQAGFSLFETNLNNDQIQHRRYCLAGDVATARAAVVTSLLKQFYLRACLNSAWGKRSGRGWT